MTNLKEYTLSGLDEETVPYENGAGRMSICFHSSGVWDGKVQLFILLDGKTEWIPLYDYKYTKNFNMKFDAPGDSAIKAKFIEYTSGSVKIAVTQ